MQNKLGNGFKIIEEGLGGRTTIFEHPIEPGRNGLALLRPVLQTHAPLDLVIFMLGTNDTKVLYNAPAAQIAQGMEALVHAAQHTLVKEHAYAPEILILSPIHLAPVQLDIFDSTSIEKSRQLAPLYEHIANRYGCGFLDAAQSAAPHPDEGIHFSREAHQMLGQAVANSVLTMLK